MNRKRTLSLCLAILLCFTPLLSACAGNEPAESADAVTTAPETVPETTLEPTPETAPETAPETTPETAPETAPETTPAETGPADGLVLSPDELALLKKNYPRTDGSTSTLPLDNAIREAICGTDYTPASHTTTHTAFYRLIHKSNDLIFSVPISPEQEKMAQDADVTIEQYAISKEAFVFVLNAENPVSALTQDQLRGIYSGQITNWKEVGGDDAPITAFQRNEDSGSQNYIKTFMGDTPLMDAPSAMRPGSMGSLMDAIALYDNAKYSIGYSYYAYAANMYGTGTELKFVAVDGVYPDEATIADDTYPLLPRNYAIIRSNSPQTARDLVRWILSPEGQKIVAENGYFSLGGEGTLPPLAVPKQILGTGPEMPETPPTFDRYYTVEVSEADVTSFLRDPAVAEAVKAHTRAIKEKTTNYTTPKVINGYMIFQYHGTDSWDFDVIDLRTGKLFTEPSDLFFYGTDFFPKVRERLSAFPGSVPPDNYDQLRFSHVFFYGSLNSVWSNIVDPRYFLPSQPYDMQGMWKDGVEVVAYFTQVKGDIGIKTDRGNVLLFDEGGALLPEDRERINAFVLAYLEEEETYQKLMQAYQRSFDEMYGNMPDETKELHGTPDHFYASLLGGRYLDIVANRVMFLSVGVKFDTRTFEPIGGNPDKILLPGWREEVERRLGVYPAEGTYEFSFSYVGATFRFPNETETKHTTLPIEWVR